MSNQQLSDRSEATGEFDAVVVGAGFAGLYMLHRLRGLGLSVRVFEAGSGVGGTWFWNRYPGARCDIESMEYSYQFSEELQQEWEWTERYSSQPEILEYINHVADRFDLHRDIQCNTRVNSAHFDAQTNRWAIVTDDGARIVSQYCVMATGCLSSINQPHFEGLDSFAGDCYQTGNWPHEGVDFTGKRVGVVGTGSSAIQAIPHIAEQADHLYVFQRTPNYSVPARNGRLDPLAQKEIKADYAGFRARNSLQGFGAAFDENEAEAVDTSPDERQREYEQRWAHGGLPFLASFSDLLSSREANETAGEFIRQKIRDTVTDPALAASLSPTHMVGCKRLCADTGYFETFNRSNVTLVDVGGSPIEKITETGIQTNNGQIDLDVIVFAIGFDAMTGAVLNIDIRGSGGQTLQKKWADGPRSYLGLAISGFPNLFTITGPGSPSVLSNMLPSIEQHVNWIADCIAYMRERDLERIDATVDAERAWVDHVNEVADETLFPTCNSWYVGANIPGKPRVFMPYLGYPQYVEKCNEIAANQYEGFALTGPNPG
jgi:cation diffusion facilitator CzcD-associated flavoprotein CzcO